jgi:hypothetical protein
MLSRATSARRSGGSPAIWSSPLPRTMLPNRMGAAPDSSSMPATGLPVTFPLAVTTLCQSCGDAPARTTIPAPTLSWM